MRLPIHNGPSGGQSQSGTRKYDLLTFAMTDGLMRVRLQKQAWKNSMGHGKAQQAQSCSDTQGIANNSFETVFARLSCATTSPLSMGERAQPLYVAVYARQKEARK
jgi:hypothetical protein